MDIQVRWTNQFVISPAPLIAYTGTLQSTIFLFLPRTSNIRPCCYWQQTMMTGLSPCIRSSTWHSYTISWGGWPNRSGVTRILCKKTTQKPYTVYLKVYTVHCRQTHWWSGLRRRLVMALENPPLKLWVVYLCIRTCVCVYVRVCVCVCVCVCVMHTDVWFKCVVCYCPDWWDCWHLWIRGWDCGSRVDLNWTVLSWDCIIIRVVLLS